MRKALPIMVVSSQVNYRIGLLIEHVPYVLYDFNEAIAQHFDALDEQ